MTIAGLLVALAAALPSGNGFAAGSGSGSSSGSSSSSSSPSANDYDDAVDLIDDEEYSDAIPLLQKVVAMEPSNADAYNYLGYANRKLGKHSEALMYYQKALSLEPEHLGANEYLGELYLEMKQLPQAEERLAVLQNACGDCEEYEDLKAEIEEYKAKQQS
jgi:tetratricopeptide (TPR) repeat protein